MQSTAAYKSQKLTNVGDNLYRNGEGTYFARVFSGGKSHKGSLKTHDRKLAERKLGEFIKKIENKEQEKPDACCLKSFDTMGISGGKGKKGR